LTEELIFEGNDLHGADLKCADLKCADLHGADMRGANLFGADLSGANLQGADLRNADMQCANLFGADLHGANLQGAYLDYAAWPLRYSSSSAIVDNQIAAQLLFYAFAVADIEPTAEQIDYIKNFRRFNEYDGADRLKRKEGN
jgi:uncharacterized protein YjbI with pentapeptide repeats